MKRTISLLLSVALVLSCLGGCRKEQQETPGNTQGMTDADEKACEKAMDRLMEAAALPESAEKDLVVEQVQHYPEESVVHYAQTWEGVEIYGSSMVVSTGADSLCLGNYYDLTGAFGEDFADQVAQAKTVPDWMADQTQGSATLAYHQDTLQPVIFLLPDGSAAVARQVEATYTTDTIQADCTVVFDLDGTVLYHCKTDAMAYTNAKVTGPDGSSIDVVSEKDTYYAYDPDLNFYVYGGDADKAQKHVGDDGVETVLSLMYSRNTADWSSGQAKKVFHAMSAYADVAAWYETVLGYKGIDGKGGTAMLVLSDQVSSSVAMNALRYGQITYLYTTAHGYTAIDAPEILAHEYGHAVIKNISGTNGSGQTAALCEAICDSFGAAYIGKWHLAENLAVDGTNKDIPGTSLTHMDDYVYDTLDDYGEVIDQTIDNPVYSFLYEIYDHASFLGIVDDYITMSSDAYHSHTNAYIVSHTLYRIWDKVFDRNNEVFASILYNSIRYLPTNANFSQFRSAFLHAARKVFDTDKVAYASTFFDVAGIPAVQKSQLVNVGTAKDVSTFSYANLLSMTYEEIRAMDWDEFNFFDSFDYPGMWYANGVKGDCSVYLDFEGETETLTAKPNSVSVSDLAMGTAGAQVLPLVTTGMTYDAVSAAYPKLSQPEYHSDAESYIVQGSVPGGLSVFLYFTDVTDGIVLTYAIISPEE